MQHGKEAAASEGLPQSQHTGSTQSLLGIAISVIAIITRRRISGSKCLSKPKYCLAAMAQEPSGVTECPSRLTGTQCDVTITKIHRCPPKLQHICTVLSPSHPRRITCSVWRQKTGTTSFGVFGARSVLKAPCWAWATRWGLRRKCSGFRP